MTKIYGHRGVKGSYPENTLLGFQKAMEQGVDGLELDVHLTKDGEVVVIHDETLDRTTSGTGWIKDLTLKEIKQVSAGSSFAHFPAYHESWVLEKVPTLKEVLQLLRPYPIELNIELKTYAIPYKGIEEKVHEIVEQYGNGRKVVYSSFHLPSILRIKQVDPNANIAMLLNEGIFLPEDYLHTLGLEAFHLNKTIFFPKMEAIQQILHASERFNFDLTNEVKHFLKSKLYEDSKQSFKNLYDKVRVWTVNDPMEMAELLDWGVSAMITDFPEQAIALKKQRRPLDG